MKTIAVVGTDGVVLNIGPWVHEQEDGTSNPFPENAQEGEYDILLTESGRYVLSNAYEELRRAAYPPIGDQLDALFKAGLFPEEMAAMLAEVKVRYPKPE